MFRAIKKIVIFRKILTFYLVEPRPKLKIICKKCCKMSQGSRAPGQSRGTRLVTFIKIHGNATAPLLLLSKIRAFLDRRMYLFWDFYESRHQSLTLSSKKYRDTLATLHRKPILWSWKWTEKSITVFNTWLGLTCRQISKMPLTFSSSLSSCAILA